MPAAKAAIPAETFQTSIRTALARFLVRTVGLPDDLAAKAWYESALIWVIILEWS